MAIQLLCGKCRELVNMSDMEEAVVGDDILYLCRPCYKKSSGRK